MREPKVWLVCVVVQLTTGYREIPIMPSPERHSVAEAICQGMKNMNPDYTFMMKEVSEENSI